MANIKLDGMSLAELTALIEQAQGAAQHKREATLQAMCHTFEEELEKNGFTFDDALTVLRPAKAPRGRKAGAQGTGKVAPKYKGKGGEVWTGRGKQPGWVKAHVAAGGKLDDLLIK